MQTLLIVLAMVSPLAGISQNQNLVDFLKSQTNTTPLKQKLPLNKAGIVAKLSPKYSVNHLNSNVSFNSKDKFKDNFNNFDLTFSKSSCDVAYSAEIYQNYLIINNSEKILAKGIPSKELSAVKDKITQITILHRLLGNDFFSSLLVPITTKTSIFLRSTENHKFEFNDYSSFLNRMNNYWNNRIVYFQLTELKKNNENRLEFWGTLFAVDHQNKTYDYADVRFHLNKKNQLDLIMWFIYPDLTF